MDWFHQLSSFRLGKVSQIKSSNKNKMMMGEKLSMVDITKNLPALDKVRKHVSFGKYES